MLTDLGFEVGKMFGSTSETAGIVAGIVEHFDRRVGMNGPVPSHGRELGQEVGETARARWPILDMCQYLIRK